MAQMRSMLTTAVGRAALLTLYCFSASADAATSYANTTLSSSMLSASSSSITTSQSSISSIGGPYMTGLSYTWSQWITPTVVGTVIVTVNEASNRTSSTTIYNSEYQSNGSVEVLSRTDTNLDGTVTEVVRDTDSRAFTVTYPDVLRYYEPEMTWNAVLPTTTNDTVTCCDLTQTTSLAPPLTSASTSSGPTDSADPSGWLYTLMPRILRLSESNISTIWDGQELTVPYTGCPYTACGPFTISDELPPTYASSAAFLLETSTTNVSSDDSTDPADEPTSPPQTSGNTGGETSAQETGRPTPTTTGDQPDQPTSDAGEEPDTPTTADGPPQDSETSVPGDNQGQPESTTNDQAPGATPSTSNGDSSGPTISTPEDDTNGGGSPTDSAGQVAPTPGSSDGGEDDSEESDDADGESSSASPPVLTIADETVTQQTDSAFVISSQTLSPGASITLGTGVDNTVVAFETGSALPAIVVGQSTAAVLTPNPTPGSALSEFTVGSSVVTADESSNFVINGETLTPGSDIVLAGTTIELASGATEVVVDGTTQAAVPSVAAGTDLPDLTIGGTTVTADQSSNYIIDGQTLAPGSTITVDGSAIELAPGATEVVVDGSTQVIATSDAVGEYIWSAFGGEPTADSAGGEDSTTSGSGSSIPQQTGSFASSISAHSLWAYLAVGTLMGFVFAL